MKTHNNVSAAAAFFAAVILCAGYNTLADAAETPSASQPVYFEDVSDAVGLSHAGASYGASWGDLNGDGWPDLWVGNHNERPSLYLNLGGRTLQDVARRVWSADEAADTHGAAWADFDHDGDQDLIEVVAATIAPKSGSVDVQSMCAGCASNYLFINQKGRLVESAEAFGADLKGLARSPLWLESNLDGRLDLFVANSPHPTLPGSTLLRNKASGFESVSGNYGFHDRRGERRLKRYRKWLGGSLRGRFSRPGRLMVKRHHNFAQLADLNGDGRLDLVNHSEPTRVFEIREARLHEITDQLYFPDLSEIGDTALADFDGDGSTDMYLTVGPYRASQVVQPTPNSLHMTLLGHRKKRDVAAGKHASFRTEGTVTFEIAPSWLDLADVKLGTAAVAPKARRFSLSPAEATALGMGPDIQSNAGGIAIGFDAASGEWRVTNKLKGEFVDVIVTSSAPIHSIDRFGFKEWRERGKDWLLLNKEGVFERAMIGEQANTPSACHSVTAADFDNDMDIDIYLVCSESVGNAPNRLLLNDGKGRFTRVANAGGAAGSELGRGDVVVAADYDRDGFVDLFVTNGADPASPFVEKGPHQLFRNLGGDNHYLEIDLRGTRSNSDGIGAKVTLVAGGVTQVREQGGGMHRFSQDHQRLHFGLASNTRADSVEVRWPDGYVQRLDNVAADQILRIVEPEEVSAESMESGS